jgi:hypothetical protein
MPIPAYEPELMRTWERDGFVLELYDPSEWSRSSSHNYITARLTDNGVVIFEPKWRIGIPSGHSLDSDYAALAVLFWLAQPYDVHDSDPENFGDYTAAQREWAAGERCQELNRLENDLQYLVDYMPADGSRPVWACRAANEETHDYLTCVECYRRCGAYLNGDLVAYSDGETSDQERPL